MLAYAKSPKGVLHLDYDGVHYILYGKELGKDPTDIPFELYNLCRESIQDGTYREDFLSKVFGKQFPEIAFTYTELRYLPVCTLDKVGPLICEDYDISWPFKRKAESIKLMLRGQDARFKDATISRWKNESQASKTD